MTPIGQAARDGPLRAALAATAHAGPFFVLDAWDLAPGPDWILVSELPGHDVAGLVADTARQLGTAERRVGASIVQQNLAARLWSPVLGCALLADVVPDLSSLHVTTSGPAIGLGLLQPSGWPGKSPRDLAARAARTVSAQLGAFGAALPARLSEGLLRGNSASAAIGALNALARYRPDLAGRAAALGRELLSTSALAGTGELIQALAFRRRSCCLYYRVPQGGLCADCCHDVAPG